MREQWYSDHRDLVKWGAVLHLAAANGISRAIQVAYLQASSHPELEIDNVRTQLPGPVWSHFRSLDQIQGLARLATIEISIVDWPFTHRTRNDFSQRLVKHLVELGSSKLVLLDPDTGFAPKTFNSRHVTHQEVAAVWDCLDAADWLVLYQHARRSKEWVTETRAQFSACCAGSQVQTIRAPACAADVVLFASGKLA